MASRTETDNVAGTVATVAFTYDARKRMIGEQRVVGATTIYNLSYTYDQLGNRLKKTDNLTGRYTQYFYDSDAANRDPLFQTNNNRLLWYTEHAPVTGGTAIVRTVKYIYYLDGNVSIITVKDHCVDSTLSPGVVADFDWHYDVAFCYYKNKHVRRVLWNRFKVDGSDVAFDFEPLTAREFRFDGGRQRYATIDYDCNGTISENLWTRIGEVEWTDYLGDTPYGDFEISDNGSGGHTLTPERRYFALGGDESLNASGGVTDSRYWHGDLIDSVSLVTKPSGTGGTGNVAPATTAYTAFGEQVSGAGFQPANVDVRYRYAGGHGYESDGIVLEGVNPTLATIRLSHVGERWYDPAIGRFVQRDPIGLRGGVNFYGYCRNSPLHWIDPDGMQQRAPVRPGTVGGVFVGTGAGGTVKAIVERNTIKKAATWGLKKASTKLIGAAICSACGGPVGFVVGFVACIAIDAAVDLTVDALRASSGEILPDEFDPKGCGVSPPGVGNWDFSLSPP
ncbi:MAG: RHS repeat-associated core domain-containing protein [Phycisphaerae bacterium]